MRKEITIGESAITFEANAATPLRFKMIFPGNDLLADLDKAESEPTSAIDTISRLAFVMMRQADKTAGNATEAQFIEWLEGFEPETFMDIDTLIEILGVYNAQAVKTVESKKKARKSPVK